MCKVINSRRTKFIGSILFVFVVYFIKIKSDLNPSKKSTNVSQQTIKSTKQESFDSEYVEQEIIRNPEIEDTKDSDVFYSENDNGIDDPAITQRTFQKKSYVSFSYYKNNKILKNNGTKYILLRTNDSMLQFREGQTLFEENNCAVKNCYFTRNIGFFDDVQRFDAIVFGPPKNEFLSEIPRSPNQQYIFASRDPAALYPAIDVKHDKFYNLTWTYKLDSDILWRYYKIYNKTGHAIGPAVNIEWLKVINTSESLNHKLLNKSKVAVRLMRHCFHDHPKEYYFRNLTKELERFNLTIDVIGSCGNDSFKTLQLDEIIKDQYYFYLAFEDYIDEDFVTDDILNALNNNAIPIVYGGADYRRFLPTGSYLSTEELTPQKMADEIHDIMGNVTRYQTFFLWKNHYYVEPSGLSEICNLCEALNTDHIMRNSIHKRFRLWWNGPKRQSVIDFFSLIFSVDKTVRNMVLHHNLTSMYQKELLNTIRRRVNVPSFDSFLNQNIYYNQP